MSATLAPTTLDELVDAVRATPHLIPVGAGTKPRLAQVSDRFTRLNLSQLRGIVEYEPDEFTFTALAGTPVRELQAALSERGQYLPFDPLLVDAGATLGGTVAASASGPGRFRFGGLRDFILGVRFVDGAGRLLRMGGKVVKNAAGFDLPKFFVGSAGRFGVLAELTFKVFPKPAATLTLKLRCETIEVTTRILTEAANARWEIEALDLSPEDGAVCLRLAGPTEALPLLAREILSRWPGETLNAADAAVFWSQLREGHWTYPDGVLIKVALTPEQLSPITPAVQLLKGGRWHVSSGGNVAFISLPDADQVPTLDETLRALGLSGVTWRGATPLWLGVQHQRRITQAVKEALDPQHQFPSLED